MVANKGAGTHPMIAPISRTKDAEIKPGSVVWNFIPLKIKQNRQSGTIKNKPAAMFPDIPNCVPVEDRAVPTHVLLN